MNTNAVEWVPSEDRNALTIVPMAAEEFKRRPVMMFGMHSLPTYAAYGLHGLRALGRLRKLCKRERFHIVQSQHEKSDLFNAFLPREAGSVHISNRRDMGFNKSTRLRWFFRFLNHRYHCVVAPAQPILSGLVRDERLALDRMAPRLSLARFRLLQLPKRVLGNAGYERLRARLL